MDIKETIQQIEKYGLSLSKSLGQNFLINDEKLQKIIDHSELSEEDLVIEIGPGLGTLSREMVPHCGRLILIEIDDSLIPALNDRFETNAKVGIIHNDALELKFDKLCAKEISEHPELKRIKVIANLPYYITTPIITKLLLEIPECERMVFTVQKEAAERIISVPRKKEYGILSVLAQFYSAPEIVEILTPACFLPQPTVNSCILKMIRREPFPLKEASLRYFLKIVQASFNQRRKTLMNSLGGSGMVPGGKQALEQILTAESLSLQCRAEELTYLQFLEITEKIMQLQTNASN